LGKWKTIVYKWIVSGELSVFEHVLGIFGLLFSVLVVF